MWRNDGSSYSTFGIVPSLSHDIPSLRGLLSKISSKAKPQRTEPEFFSAPALLLLRKSSQWSCFHVFSLCTDTGSHSSRHLCVTGSASHSFSSYLFNSWYMQGSRRPVTLGRGAGENNRAGKTVISFKSSGYNMPGITAGSGDLQLCQLHRVEEVFGISSQSSAINSLIDSLSVCLRVNG